MINGFIGLYFVYLMDVVAVLFIYCNVSPDEYYTKRFQSKMPLTVCFLLALYMFASPSHLFINIYILAGPALFRGRLRAFGKCTDLVASSKGRLNLDSVRLIV